MALVAIDEFDQIVFSGRYAIAGRMLGPWLQERIPTPGTTNQPEWHCYKTPLKHFTIETPQDPPRPAATPPEEGNPTALSHSPLLRRGAAHPEFIEGERRM